MNKGKEIIKEREDVSTMNAQGILQWAFKRFGNEIAFATSFGAEDQVIIDMISKLGLDIEIFSLDTGRLFNETYELISRTEKHYNKKIKVFFPEGREVEKIVRENGVNLFYENIENRKLCCRVRKLNPLSRALAHCYAWICGLRKEQSLTRIDAAVIDWDQANCKAKINPLIEWTEKEVWDYIKENNVPYDSLVINRFFTFCCG